MSGPQWCHCWTVSGSDMSDSDRMMTHILSLQRIMSNWAICEASDLQFQLLQQWLRRRLFVLRYNPWSFMCTFSRWQNSTWHLDDTLPNDLILQILLLSLGWRLMFPFFRTKSANLLINATLGSCTTWTSTVSRWLSKKDGDVATGGSSRAALPSATLLQRDTGRRWEPWEWSRERKVKETDF